MNLAELIAEIVAAFQAALGVALVGIDIIGQMSDEGRTELTPEEIAKLKAEQAEADADWQEQLEALRRKAAEGGTDAS